jgi:endonuclease G, mitochondrial
MRFLIILILFAAIQAKDGLEIPVISDSAAFIIHHGFTLEYAEKYEQAKWVAYELDKAKASVVIPRTDNFKADPAVKTGSASLEDYKGSGFDRGHLFPAADAWDSASMNECFYLSNMSPQVHAFNGGIWAKLEEQVRNWALEFDTIYIVTGPILKNGLPTIGPDSVAIPEYFYKAILCINHKDTMEIGFILKHEGSQNPLKSFAVTIDSLEIVSGIDFFPSLANSTESKVESHIDTTKWFNPSAIIPQKHTPTKKHNKHQTYLNKKSILIDVMGRKLSPFSLASKTQLLITYDKESFDTKHFLKM